MASPSRSQHRIFAGCPRRLTGDDVVRVFDEITTSRPAPQSIRVDNGPEFISRSLDWWAYFHGVKLDFSRPGKPTDNALIESFNGKFRQECLNQHWFPSLEDAQAHVNFWREDYNRRRPRSSLGDRTLRAKIDLQPENSSKWIKLGGKVTTRQP